MLSSDQQYTNNSLKSLNLVKNNISFLVIRIAILILKFLLIN